MATALLEAAIPLVWGLEHLSEWFFPTFLSVLLVHILYTAAREMYFQNTLCVYCFKLERMLSNTEYNSAVKIVHDSELQMKNIILKNKHLNIIY